ncbi:hypothetical protein M422DRAFT_265754, partial [Sphaerobolus stellatus SS14]
TGFPGQRPGGFAPQQTGFPQQGFQQSQPTGFPQGGLQPQATGFSGLGYQQTGFQGAGPGYQQRAPPPPPVPPIPSRFQGQPQSQLQPTQTGVPGFLGGGLQQRSFISSSSGPLIPQPTGFPSGGLVPQVTGFVDPRLQLLRNTFLPANLSAP